MKLKRFSPFSYLIIPIFNLTLKPVKLLLELILISDIVACVLCVLRGGEVKSSK